MAKYEREVSVGESQAFKLEYEKTSSDAELYEDIVSYLGEYRLNVQKYNYELQFCGANIFDLHLRAGIKGEPMYVKAKRSIAERRKKSLPTHREEAELEALGDPENLSKNSLKYQLRFAQDGDTVIWGSPPGPKEEGYGDYGFIFTGRVNKISDLEIRLPMTAIRVENPTLQQYNSAFSALTGHSVAFRHEDEFLAHPFVKNGSMETVDIDQILRNNFSFEVDSDSQAIFDKVIKHLRPSISEFISLTKTGSREEKLQAFYALENYALELKARFKQERNEKIIYLDEYRPLPLRQLASLYGYEPPAALGSCGATGRINSNNPLANGYEKLMKALFGEDEGFECPECHYQTNDPVGDKCPNCKLTKEEYAKKTGQPVCG